MCVGDYKVVWLDDRYVKNSPQHTTDVWILLVTIHEITFSKTFCEDK